MWDTDTMDGQVKSLYGNRYAQVLSNGTYFATKYPMDRKSDTRQALRMFVMELGPFSAHRSLKHQAPSQTS